MLLNLREEVISLVLEALSSEYSLNYNKEELISKLEIPKSVEMGHVAFPVFFLAKELRKSPKDIASQLATNINAHLDAKLSGNLKDVSPAAGYINFKFKSFYLQNLLFKAVEKLSSLDNAKLKSSGKKVLVDYCSPNVAKPMHIGHFRATIMGQAICNLARSQGHEVIALNHLGDWGTQFGKLAWAIQNWGSEYPLEKEPIESLLKLYIRFHEEAEANAEIEKAGAETFKKLEDGDEEILKLWEKIVSLSLAEYDKTLSRLRVKHSLIRGESFYNDRLDDIVEKLNKAKLLKESEGAQIVDLESDNMPPCLIKKADGASLYATRDLASALYRMEELGVNENLNVVGSEQTLHFQQVFKVLEKMGYDWVKDCHHISFGRYRFKDGEMSTRKGKLIRLNEMLDKAHTIAKEIIQKKNPDLKNKDIIAEQVGIGALIFYDLLNDRNKDIEFDWEKVMNFEGDSGPYVQYCQVRCRSVLAKSKCKPLYKECLELETTEEQELVKTLLSYDEVLQSSYSLYKPHILANYLLEVCKAFGHFYHKCRIVGEEEKLEGSRLALVASVQKVIEDGLSVLNIESPEAM